MIGGVLFQILLELFTVDSGCTRRDEHAHIGHSSERAKFVELGVFEFWKFCPGDATFLGYNVDFLATRGR